MAANKIICTTNQVDYSAIRKAMCAGARTPTNCKTPEQSLYGAIFREIKVTEQPRFRKSAKKGAFEYAL